MKIFRAITAVAFLAVVSCGSALAQRPAGTQPQPRPNTTPSGPATSANVPDSKVALIDSSAFADEKQGIFRFVAALKKVNAEFQPRQTELQGLQQQIEKATADLQKAAPVQDPKVSQQQQDKIDQMKKDYQRKGEDAQAAFNKRLEEVLNPVYEDIGKALDTFAKARGITLILDVTKVQGIVSFADGLDITRAFIAEYNSKNPATASLTKPE
ncbi:MAG TPA: OmpH family outer membrane protein [Pyrinomonadaceae bacterium]